MEESAGRKKKCAWVGKKKRKKEWTEGADRKQKCENRGGQRWMTTSTCPNLLLSLQAFLSPCNGQSWWCPLRGRERETKWQSERLAWWQAYLASPLYLTLVPFSSFLRLCLFVFCILPSHNPSRDIIGLQRVPRSKNPWLSVLLQSSMSASFLLFFSFTHSSYKAVIHWSKVLNILCSEYPEL